MSYLAKLEQTINQSLHCAADIGDEWETPDLEFLGIAAKFGPFSIDLFATERNTKAPLFITAEENSLEQSWGLQCSDSNQAKRGYANPPFSKPHVGMCDDGLTRTGLDNVFSKAVAEFQLGFYSVLFVPNNPEADWFSLVEQHATGIYFTTKGRVSFRAPHWYKQDPNGSKPSSSRGGMIIAVFDPAHRGEQTLGFISREQLREWGEQELERRFPDTGSQLAYRLGWGFKLSSAQLATADELFNQALEDQEIAIGEGTLTLDDLVECFHNDMATSYNSVPATLLNRRCIRALLRATLQRIQEKAA